MVSRSIVVIGGSAGALQPLIGVLEELPASLRAAVLVVIHSAADNPGILATILDRAGPLRAEHGLPGEELQDGRVYVARPDRHLLVHERRIQLGRGPKENGFRPAVDPLFRTAAAEFGPRTIGVVLSGGLRDGAYGLALIKEAGGVAIVHDPEEAMVPSMPLSALSTLEVDHVLPAASIAAAIAAQVARWAQEEKEDAMQEDQEGSRQDIAATGRRGLKNGSMPGQASGLTCPDCGGALWEGSTRTVPHFECHVGHAHSETSLLEGQAKSVEAALWVALRALEEHAAFARRIAERTREAGLDRFARENDAKAQKADEHAEVLRRLLLQPEK